MINQNIKIKKRENQEDDRGLESKNITAQIQDDEDKKMDFGIFKPIIGLLITIIIFLLKPADDIYYYVASFISIGFTIWSFYNIIKKINILTTRKLPQLEKRGGDENA